MISTSHRLTRLKTVLGNILLLNLELLDLWLGLLYILRLLLLKQDCVNWLVDDLKSFNFAHDHCFKILYAVPRHVLLAPSMGHLARIRIVYGIHIVEIKWAVAFWVTGHGCKLVLSLGLCLWNPVTNCV